MHAKCGFQNKVTHNMAVNSWQSVHLVSVNCGLFGKPNRGGKPIGLVLHYPIS